MPNTVRRDETSLAGHQVKYEVRRSDDATEPRIDVDIHGVVVVLPVNSQADAEQLLAENSSWVLEKKAKYGRYRDQAPERRFEVGESFPILDDPHELAVEPRPDHAVCGGTVVLAESKVAGSSLKDELEAVYRRTAREHLTERADHYTEEMGVTYERIELRNQRTRWGSCSTTGTLSLNWRLVMAPPAVVDYIVIHELAHLVESNHSDAFWSLVAEHDSAYQEHAQWLEENSVQLVFSKDDL